MTWQHPTQANAHWLLIADARNARLLRAAWRRAGRMQLLPQAKIAEEWDEVQHQRPSSRTGKSGHCYASEGNEEAERIRRFAKRLSDWLEREVARKDIVQLDLFAAPRLLGQLREVMPQRLSERCNQHCTDLGGLTLAELASHGTIMAAVSRPASILDHSATLDRETILVRMASDRALARQLAAEHAGLRSAIRGILTELDRLRGERVNEHSPGDLPARLRMLQEHLTQHFQLEESTRLFAKDDAGEHQANVDALLIQHAQLAHDLANLVDAVERAEGDPVLSEQFVTGLRNFFERLVRHENEEHDLVRDRMAQTVVDETGSPNG